MRQELVMTYGRVLLESLRDDDKLGRVTRGLANEHIRRGGEEGPVKGVRLRDAYRCLLPTANLMRALGSIGVELTGIVLPAGAGELLGIAAEVDEIRLMDHMKPPWRGTLLGAKAVMGLGLLLTRGRSGRRARASDDRKGGGVCP